jgi:hypothetical protein
MKNIFFQNQLISNIIIVIYVARVQNITFLYKWEVYTHGRDDCCNLTLYTQLNT